MRALFPQFVGWLLFGASVGLIVQILNDVSAKLVPEQPVNIPTPIRATRVVILGGGFAGMSTALFLECELRADRSVSSPWSVKINLFTPMLAEVAGGSVEPSHISTPLRTSLQRTNVVRARVTGVDFRRRRGPRRSDRL
jgi:NADH:ubiquinone reductase (H+-translocating)